MKTVIAIVFAFGLLLQAFAQNATNAQCQKEVETCESNFVAGVKAAGQDAAAQCTAGTTLMSCLDTQEKRPQCASIKDAISALRLTYSTQISTDGCATNDPGSAKLNCNRNVKDCESQFVVGVKKAGANTAAACSAGAALEMCLQNLEKTPNCASSQAVIDLMRKTYKTQIDSDGCATAASPTVTKCQGDVIACEKAFTDAVAAAGQNAVVQCSAGATFMKCLDDKDNIPECASAKGVIAAMRTTFSAQILAAGCGTGSKPTVTQCQGEVLACQKTFTAAIGAAGENVNAQCSAGAALSKCLDAKDKAPECASIKDSINSLRKTFADQIKNDGCGDVDPSSPKVECNDDVKACEDDFLNGINDAGSSVNAACIAGSTLENCLKQRESQTDCKGSKDVIDTIRKSYKQQIDQDGCSSTAAKACVQGIQNCQGNLSMADASKMTDSQKCSTANMYVDCLNDLSCSASYKRQLTTLYQLVQSEIKATGSSCHLKSLHGDSSHVKPSSLVVITTFLMAFLISLR